MSRILIISNRAVNESFRDEKIFGPGFNSAGPSELRIAEAVYHLPQKEWSLSLVPEDHTSSDPYLGTPEKARSIAGQLVSAAGNR